MLKLAAGERVTVAIVKALFGRCKPGRVFKQRRSELTVTCNVRPVVLRNYPPFIFAHRARRQRTPSFESAQNLPEVAEAVV